MTQTSWIRAALERHERRLVLYATRITGDVERARDAVQETFLRLCRAERDEVEDHLAAWLYTTCRNVALDVLKKEQPMNPLPDTQAARQTAGDPSPAQSAETRDSVRQVQELMDGLPDNQREVLRLKFQHGLSYKEIARVTSLSVSNVGFLIHTGLKTLRQTLRTAS